MGTAMRRERACHPAQGEGLGSCQCWGKCEIRGCINDPPCVTFQLRCHGKAWEAGAQVGKVLSPDMEIPLP